MKDEYGIAGLTLHDWVTVFLYTVAVLLTSAAAAATAGFIIVAIMATIARTMK